MNAFSLFKFILIVILTLINYFDCFSQDSISINILKEKIKSLENSNSKTIKDLENYNNELKIQINSINDSIIKLNYNINLNKVNIDSISRSLNNKLEENKSNSIEQISSIDKSLSKNTLYWIIAVLTIALLSLLLFSLLRKQLTKNNSDLTYNIQQTKKALEEEGVKLDSKLVDLLATQMQLMKEERKTVTSSKPEEVNHELALKVADEIIRIQKNLGSMDAETKGLKQLIASVKRIQDNFEANGYELIDMLNRPYDQGMKISANFRPDETLSKDEQIITRIIKPQVNFKGVMIQAAQVEVSIGE